MVALAALAVATVPQNRGTAVLGPVTISTTLTDSTTITDSFSNALIQTIHEILTDSSGVSSRLTAAVTSGTTSSGTTTQVGVPQFPTTRNGALLLAAILFLTVTALIGKFFRLRRND